MKYFITGATGFIGGKIAQQLAAQGHNVIALARTPAKATALSQAGITVVAGDVTDKESMRASMKGVDGVFHVAGWYKIGRRDKREAVAINVDGTRNVLELMKELGIAKGVYTSTLAVYSNTHGELVDESYHFNGPHVTEYDRTKWVAHYEIAEPMMAAGLPLVIAQPGLVYGPGDTSPIHTSLVAYLKRQLPVIPAGVAYCWGHVDDIARGHIQAMEKGRTGESYNICGPRYTMIEAFTLAERITGIPASRWRPGPSTFRRGAAVMGIIERVLPIPELFSSETLRVSAGVTYLGDNSKAKQELGFTVRSLEDGLPETLHYEMQQLGLEVKR